MCVCVYVCRFKGVRSYLRKLVFCVRWVGSELRRRRVDYRCCCSFWVGSLRSPDSLLICDPISACPSDEPWLLGEDFHLRNQHSAVGKRGREGDSELRRRKGKEVFSLSVLPEGVRGAGFAPSTQIRGLPGPAMGVPHPARVRLSVGRVFLSFFSFFLLSLLFFFTSGKEQPPAGRGRCRRRGAGLLSPPWKVFNRFSQITR